METDRLRYFCIIVDTGSLTKASELIGISHSGLSKSMSTLQDELGYKIFTPKGRGLELTEKGKTLYRQSTQIIELVNVIKTKTSLQTNSIRIGFPEAIALVVTNSITSELKCGLTIEDLDSGEIENRVLSRQNDFAFTFVPFPHKELDHLKITKISLSSFRRINYFHEQDPETIPYVIPTNEVKNNPLSIRSRDGWNTNLTRYTPYRANSLTIALSMVHSGVCAIYTANFIADYFNQFQSKNQKLVELDLTTQRKIQERTQRDIFLVKRHNEEETKLMKTIVKIVKQNCKDY